MPVAVRCRCGQLATTRYPCKRCGGTSAMAHFHAEHCPVCLQVADAGVGHHGAVGLTGFSMKWTDTGAIHLALRPSVGLAAEGGYASREAFVCPDSHAHPHDQKGHDHERD